MTEKTQRLTTLAIMSAIAYLVMFLTHELNFMPGYPFLSLDMKDVIIAIGGFIYGPVAAAMMSAVVSVIEMLTVSSTGFIGLLMNVLSTCAFACTAAAIYKRRQTLASAIVGLVLGCLAATGVMLLWNYLITPLYQGVPRNVIAAALLPAFLPFNLIKYGLNAAIALLLYKPLVGALRRAHLVPASQKQSSTGKINIGVMLLAIVVLATLVLIILAYKGVI